MRLLLIRHAEPDYTIDSLTPKGFREANLLADRPEWKNVTDFYVSPLGRAKATAKPVLEKYGREATEYAWLQEFPVRITRPDCPQQTSIAWDWLPQDWTQRENFFRKDHWFEEPEYAQVGPEYFRIMREFDAFLAQHGYVRDGYLYRVQKPNRDTLAFFCHFGIACALMSHLMHVSPVILWHHIALLPSSVTSIYTEERVEGTAQFRANLIGDVSHLTNAGEEPSFHARFCETFDGPERH